jgi:hypothetical protein
LRIWNFRDPFYYWSLNQNAKLWNSYAAKISAKAPQNFFLFLTDWPESYGRWTIEQCIIAGLIQAEAF